MFPLNLQRNIVQLDRQISLLENDCKNMELEKKKSFKSTPSYTTCSKISSVRLKPPAVKVTLKKNDCNKKSKKSSPPVSAKLQSTSSLPSHYPKTWSEIGDVSVGRRAKLCGLNTNIPECSCQILESPHCNVRKENKRVKCVCSNEISVSNSVNCLTPKGGEKDHVLHKELLFPNCGGAIEVVVTQKSNNEKENSPVNQKSPFKKSVNLDNNIGKDSGNCKCQIKGQKWSEILCVDASKRKELNSENNSKNKISADETKTICQPLSFINNRIPEESSYNYYNDCNETIEKERFKEPVKLQSQPYKMKRQIAINSSPVKEEIEGFLTNYSCGEPAKELKDPVKIFQYLLNHFSQGPNEELKKLAADPKNTNTFKEVLKELSKENKDNFLPNDTGQSSAAFMNAVTQHCENLIKEKALLSQELLAKDNVIATMKKREEEYLSLITSLKSNLQKNKGNAQESIDTIKEINAIKSKLQEQMKISEALQNIQVKLQQLVEQFSYENDRLRTQLKICELEAQKHEVLLAGKEAEINRYREEIQNFQRQIKEHLASLKSNAQEIDIEKMMEAVIQQSQIFAQTDIDSVIERDQKDSLNLQNVLMHSSPTSTKTSAINSSWKQISSIHDHDQSKANSDVIIYLNDDSKEKDFFQIFKENSFSELRSPKKSNEPFSDKPLDKKEIKKSSSFTSCLSVHDDQDDDKNSNCDSLISKESLISIDEKLDEQLKKNSQVSTEKVQSNIDELLKNMKLKFSKELFETSLPSCTTEDFLDMSQISSISPL